MDDLLKTPTVRFRLEGYEFLVDGLAPIFAAVLKRRAGEPAPAEAAIRLAKQLDVLAAIVTEEIRSTTDAETFFLFKVDAYHADRVFDAISSFRVQDDGDGQPRDFALVGLVVSVWNGRASLVVDDPGAAKDAEIRDRYRPPRQVILLPEGEFLPAKDRLRASGPLPILLARFEGRLEELRVAVEMPKEHPRPHRPRHGSRGHLPLVFRKPPTQKRSGGHALASQEEPWIGSIELAVLDDNHPLVDSASLRRAIICGDTISSLDTHATPPALCPPPTFEQQSHATKVFGLVSASLPVGTAGGASGVVSIGCAPGATTLKHLAIAWPNAVQIIDPAIAAERLSDLLRWMTGLPLSFCHTPAWPSLSSIGAKPVRVINLSRWFTDVGIGQFMTPSAWSELGTAMVDVTTQSFSGRGAVVVLSAPNIDILLSEMDLPLPCRNSLLLVTAVRSPENGRVRGLVGNGPHVSLAAQGGDRDMLAMPVSSPMPTLCETEPNAYTSFASPDVSSVCGRIAQVRPDLSAADIARVVRESSSVLDANCSERVGRWIRLSRDRTRMIDPDPAAPSEDAPALAGNETWFSLWYGQGWMNADLALQMAAALP